MPTLISSSQLKSSELSLKHYIKATKYYIWQISLIKVLVKNLKFSAAYCMSLELRQFSY